MQNEHRTDDVADNRSSVCPVISIDGLEDYLMGSKHITDYTMQPSTQMKDAIAQQYRSTLSRFVPVA